MSNRPRKAKVLTPHQQATKSRFLLAVEFAKKQIADPVLKAKYQPSPGSKFTSAYIAAIADYLRGAKQDENGMEETENGHDGLEQKVIVIIEADSTDVKANTTRHSENVVKEIERCGRTDNYFVDIDTATKSHVFFKDVIRLSGDIPYIAMRGPIIRAGPIRLAAESQFRKSGSL